MTDVIRSNNNKKRNYRGGNNNAISTTTNSSCGPTTCCSPFYIFCIMAFIGLVSYDTNLFGLLSPSNNSNNNNSARIQNNFNAPTSTQQSPSLLVSQQKPAKRKRNRTVTSYYVYKPADIEQYVIEHAGTLGLNETNNDLLPNSCDVLMKPDVAPEIYDSIQSYIKGLDKYNLLQLDHRVKPAIPDIRKRLQAGESNANVCSSIDYLQLDKIFGSNTGTNDEKNSNGTQTKVSYSSSMGYMEPLMPPLRHPKFCYPGNFDKYLLRADYIIHDFYSICHSMKPHSKLVLMDLGIDIQTTQLSEIYYHWGFPFDHIYSASMDWTTVQRAYHRRPTYLKKAYRPINIEVSANPDNTQSNPFKFVLDNFDEDDMIVVKLDIDKADTELTLIQQLLNDTELQSLIDHLYFEHHVHQKELLPAWGGDKVKGSILESLQLFQSLRNVGVTTHYWP